MRELWSKERGVASLRAIGVIAACLGSSRLLAGADAPRNGGHDASLAAASVSAGPRPASLLSWDTAAIERARAGAARRLETPACQKILSDYTDSEGRTLLQNLETWQLGAADYLHVISFVDGSSIRNCQKTSVPLATSPGLQVVYVCPAGIAVGGSRFAQIEIRNSSLAEFMVIHEMLHTLGLGENPPSTFEITDHVKQRCR